MKPRDLRLLVMHVSTRCDQACAHCSIWKSKGKGRGELGVEERLAVMGEARSLGATAILFTGGEPLLCEHLEVLARTAKGLGLSVQLATNGLGLARCAPWLGDAIDEVYVSLEGPEDVHDGVRGPRMFARLRASIREVLALSRRPRLIGRTAISARNAAFLEATVWTARTLGLDAVSFLPIDVASDAFGGGPEARASLKPGPSQVARLREAVAALSTSGELGGFVLEDERKLMRMAEAFLRDAALRTAPPCNAPEWSSVVEADGAVRPCFFQPPVAGAGQLSLRAVRKSPEYAAALRGLGDGNRICASCVCPKQGAPTRFGELRDRLNRTLERAARPWFQWAGTA